MRPMQECELLRAELRLLLSPWTLGRLCTLKTARTTLPRRYDLEQEDGERGPTQLVVISDPGQDLDDEMAFILMSAGDGELWKACSP